MIYACQSAALDGTEGEVFGMDYERGWYVEYGGSSGDLFVIAEESMLDENTERLGPFHSADQIAAGVQMAALMRGVGVPDGLIVWNEEPHGFPFFDLRTKTVTERPLGSYLTQAYYAPTSEEKK